MKVSPTADDPVLQWFAYTIGLAVTQKWPELICFGLDVDVMGKMLNNAVQELREKAIAPQPNCQLTGVLEGSAVCLRPFHKAYFREHLGWATWFAAHNGLKPQNFDCLQVMWPDKNGRFPFEDACEPEVSDLQKPAVAPH